MSRTIALVLAASLLSACNNDLDINADYKDIPVVYGLLNQRDSVHFVKINKAFLGEGNALDMALVADSNEYRGEAISLAQVELLDGSGNVTATYPLRDTLITNREPGLFNAPEQKLYYFTTPFVTTINDIRLYLQQDSKYRLKLVVKGQEITSTTPIANNFTFPGTTVDTVNQNSRVALRNAFGTAYNDYSFNWNSRADNKRFEVTYRFRFDEVTGTDTVHLAYEQSLGTRVTANSAQNQELTVNMSGESFYSGLATFCKSRPNWSSVDKRIFRGLDFLVTAANDDFHTYLTLTEPVSGIIEDRPAYSNVNGALGIWGSRYNKNVQGKRLSQTSLQELLDGPYTFELRFCSALDPGGSFSCN